MSIVIRRAREEDAGDIAYLAYLAGKSHAMISVYDLMFPGPSGPKRERLGVMQKLLSTQVASWFHFSKFLVTEFDGRVASCLSVFDHEEAANRLLASSLVEIGWTEEDFSRMREGLEPVLKVKPPTPEGNWVFENVATHPDFRRRGLTRMLLEEGIEMGRSRGLERAQISIIMGNEPALRAYEKVGFKVAREYTDESFEELFGYPGMVRMEMTLDTPPRA